jgi:DNA-binding SARP family transcriptional activator
LSESGDDARALAILAGNHDVLVRTLIACGERLVQAGQSACVRDALDSLPAPTLLATPRALLLKALELGQRGEHDEVIRVVRLVMSLCEDEGSDTRIGAEAILASLQARSGQFKELSEGIESLMHRVLAAGDRARVLDALAAAVAGLGLAGDRDGLESCLRLAQDMGAMPEASGVYPHIEVVTAVLSGLLDGDWAASADGFRRLSARAGLPVGTQAAILNNCAASAFQAGMFPEALEAVARASIAAREGEDPVDLAVAHVLEAEIRTFVGESVDWQAPLHILARLTAGSGAGFVLTAALLYSASLALTLGQRDQARALADQALSCALSTCSPILLWHGELVQAETLLVSGDRARARDTAAAIVARVEKIGAMGHALVARMILAADSLAEGRLDEAVAHIAQVSAYIEEKTPVVVLASFLRPLPELLAPLAMAMGVDRIPMRVLRVLRAEDVDTAKDRIPGLLSDADGDRLKSRISAASAEEAARERSSAEPSADLVCTVRLFGGFEVHTPDRQVGDRVWTKRKARLLFAMLVSRSGQDVPRDQIIEYLWPDMDEQRALNNFYVVWSAMKRALAPDSTRELTCPYVEHVRGVCRVVPGRVKSDLDQFEKLLAASRKARSARDTQAELAALLDLAEVYTGGLLPGDAYDDWFSNLRELTRHEYEDAMLRAAELLEARDARQALGLVRRALDQDPWREDLYQAALRLQIAAGQRSAAIDTYLSCRTRLVDELGIDPSGETTRLYQSVLGMGDVA